MAIYRHGRNLWRSSGCIGNDREYFPYPRVSAIHQDPCGFLWSIWVFRNLARSPIQSALGVYRGIRAYWSLYDCL